MSRFYIIVLCFIGAVGCTKGNGIIELTPGAERESKTHWRLIGPGDADQVTAISISKKGIVYISTDIGGVYRSNDNGESWEPINKGIRSYDVVTPVLIDPDDEKVLYIGTRGGFYKSRDGGQTWAPKWNGVGNGKPAYSSISACVGSIAIDPANSEIIYMGFGNRSGKMKWTGNIYRSSDKGESWRVISSLGKGVMIRHIHAVTHEIIYIASNTGLFKSSNAGNSWEKIVNIPARSIVTHPEHPHIVYFAAGNKGVYKSYDSGENWVKINNGLSLRSGKPEHTDNYTRILIDIKKPDTIYTISTTWGMGGGVYRSLNGGESWEVITRWDNTIKPPWKAGANVESSWLKRSSKVNGIAIDPGNSNRIFIGTSRYIYKTEDSGGAWKQLISRKVTDNTWTHRGINLFGHTRVVGIDPIDPNKLYIGTADHGLVKSVDGGRSWKESVRGMKYKDNVLDMVIDYNDPGTIYVINGKVGFRVAGVAKSYDYGENWTQINDGLRKSMYYTILLDSENSNMLYAGGKGGVFRTENGGKKWIFKGLKPLTVRKLVFHPQDSHVMFAATNKGLYKTVDSGDSWRRTHLTDMNLYTLIIDPKRPDTIYAGAVQDGRRNLQGGVFKSLDSGKRWKKVLHARKIESMALVPTSPIVLYAVSNDHQYHDESSGEGVFRSIDGGESWESFNHGLPVLRAFNINTAPYPPYSLYLSSNGSGAYVATDPVTALTAK